MPESFACTAGGKALPSIELIRCDARLIARFWSKVQREGDCLVWQGSKDEDGYGFFSISHEGIEFSLAAHRVGYALGHGAWPSTTLMVMHKCDNPSCVNPGHLVEGTRSQNLTDAWKRNRRDRPRGTRYGTALWRGARCSTNSLRGRSRLTEPEVIDIRSRHAKGLLADADDYAILAVELGVSVTTLKDVVKRRTFKHVAGGPS